MPLPLLIGAAALVTAAYGAKKGYDGYQKHSEADEIVKSAEADYNKVKNIHSKQEKETTSSLERLGKKELEIGKKIHEFQTLAESLISKLNQNSLKKIDLKIPKHELQKIEEYSYTAIGVLGTAVGAGATGAAVGFAVYGGVMALGAASTGTAISALSGAAATNATLAALGGGALSAGGLGMAGGTAILGAAVAAPVLAIAGWAYDNHGEESLKNANKIKNEVKDTITKLNLATAHLQKTYLYSTKIIDALESIFSHFEKHLFSLEKINSLLNNAKNLGLDENEELSKLKEDVIQSVENGFALASILVDIITTPIFKPKIIDGKTLKDENGVPEMEKDSDGSMILNHVALDDVLQENISAAQKIS